MRQKVAAKANQDISALVTTCHLVEVAEAEVVPVGAEAAETEVEVDVEVAVVPAGGVLEVDHGNVAVEAVAERAEAIVDDAARAEVGRKRIAAEANRARRAGSEEVAAEARKGSEKAAWISKKIKTKTKMK